MLKIYLDWNIISYLKTDEHKDLRNYIAQVNNYFIFPFSRAHIQDLYQSKSPSNIENFENDLNTITDICQTHLLNYQDSIDAPYPYECTPRQFIEMESVTLNAYTSGYDSINFTDFLKSMMDAASYEAFQTLLSANQLKMPITNPTNGELIMNLWDALMFSLDNFSKILQDKKFEVEFFKSMCDIEGEKNIQEMQKINPSEIFDYLNNLTISRTGKSFTDTIISTLKKINGNNNLNYFLAEYASLAFCAYSRDKNRNILNIMTDALHSFYAMRCDVLVTRDKGMQRKAEAEFKHFNSPTRIISIEDLQSFLEEELEREYNLNYIQKEVIPKYSIGEDRGDGKLAYKNVPSPIFGLFTNCIKIPNAPNALVLKVNLKPNGYIYYTELKRFFDLLMEGLSDKHETTFRKEVIEKFLSRNKDIILSIRTYFKYDRWNIELVADPESPVPLPMLIIRKSG